MKQQFSNTNPSKKTRKILLTINAIIEQYQAQDYTLTLRQLYYQLVSKNIIPNEERQYQKLSRVLKEGRMAGIVDWEAIEDRLRQIRKVNTFDNPAEILKAAMSHYQIDRNQGQETYLEILLEKEALSQVVQRSAIPYQIPVLVNRGYGSVTAIYDIYQRLTAALDSGKEKLVILYLGDHDPSGLDMIRDITDRVKEMLKADYNEDKLTVKHIALTKEQIRKYAPPPNPAKLTDTRSAKYVSKHGYQSWEVDALPPAVLSNLITESIEQYLDFEKLSHWENVERERTKKKSKP